MTSDQRAPVQGFSAGIPWSLHLRAWDAYAKKYGRSQTAERLAERGGFGTCELDVFVPGWLDEVSEITRLQEALAAAEARIAETRKKALEEAAGIEVPFMLESPSHAVERYRAAIRSLSADEAQP